MKNKYTKGFSLIELLVSMLVVAIAMLGFAALQAYSSRTIASSFTKNVGSNIVLDISRMFQMGVLDVASLDWTNDHIDIKCSKADGMDLENINGEDSQALYANIKSVCSNIRSGKLKGIDKAFLSARLVRENLNFNTSSSGESSTTTSPLPKYFRYKIDITFAYRPLTNKTADVEKTEDLQKFDSAAMKNICPNKYEDEYKNNEQSAKEFRSKANVVCSRIEVNL